MSTATLSRPRTESGAKQPLGTLVVNEFAKMRHLKVLVLPLIMLVGVTGLTLFRALASGAFSADSPGDGFPWKLMLASMSFAITMIYPIFLSVMASRLVEVEHRGNGWLLSAGTGATPGQLCRAKLIALGIPVLAATVSQSALIAGLSFVAGVEDPFPAGLWIAYTVSVAAINLVVLATHLLISAVIENQLVCLGIGVAGLFLAVFGSAFPPAFSHLTPWGYYALATPADYVGMELVYFDMPVLSLIALTVIGAGAFLAITARFDHQEL